MTNRVRILVADDHLLILDGLRSILEARYDLVGVVEDGRALVEADARLQPDVVLVDISMPLLNGIEAARQIRVRRPDAKIIFVTVHSDPAYVREAFKAGASGYVIKRSAASELIEAIDEVAQGRTYVTPLVAPRKAQELERALAGNASFDPERVFRELTPRQREVLQLVAEGHSTKEIASQLSISVKTVEFHKARIMDQLGMRTTAELTRYAVAHGLVA